MDGSSVVLRSELTVAARVVLLTVFVVSIATTVAFVVVQDSRSTIVALALATMMLGLLPLLWVGQLDIFDPYWLAIVSVAVGSVLRPLALVLGMLEPVEDYFLLGRSIDLLVSGQAAMLLAVIVMLLGAWTGTREPGMSRLEALPALRFDVRRTRRVMWGLLVLSALGLLLFVIRADVSAGTFAELSSKRRLEVEGGEYAYAALGYERWVGSLASYGFLVMVGLHATRRRRFFKGAALLLGLTVLTVALPVLASSRTQLLIPVAAAAALWHYLRRPISAQRLIASVLLFGVAFIALGGLRAVSQQGENFDEYVADVPLALLANRNWADVTKTSHIISGIPDVADHRYGTTMASWIAAPIPRTMWPEKPVIRSGIELGALLFERGTNNRSGVPPGLVGELYWNFGWGGIVVGMFLFGKLLKRLRSALPKLLEKGSPYVVAYVLVLFPIGLQLIGSDVSGIVISLLRNVLTVLPLLFLCTRRVATLPSEKAPLSSGVGPRD